MLSASLCLHECLLKYLVREAVAFDIHLCSRKTILGTSGLEVHVSKVVLITKDVGKNSILVFARVLDKSHGNTADRLLHRYTSIHQGKCACAYGSHR